MTFASIWLGLASLVSELALAWRKRSKRGPEGQDVDAGSLKLLWRVIGCAMTAGVLLAVFGIGPRFPPGWPWGWISVGLFALGTALRWWAILHLGRFFTVDVAVAEDHQLVDTGPYRWVRHPSYSGLLLQFAAVGISLANFLSLAVIFLPICWALIRRIRVEENALTVAIGLPYERYISGTKRLVPLVY